MKSVLLLLVLPAFSVLAQPMVNGDMSDAAYTTIGTFTSGRNSFGDGNDMGVIKYYTDNTTIYMGITGEVTANDNIVLFFNFSGYVGRSGTLAGSGTCGTAAFRTSSTASDYGLDGAIMDMDIDFALGFNEDNSSTSFFVDAARYGNDGIINCGNLGNTMSQSGATGTFNAGAVFNSPSNINMTVAYHNNYFGDINKGIEFSIPIAAFAGVDNTMTLQVFAIITNIFGYMSNETIPGDAGATNLGNDYNLSSISGQDFFTSAVSLPLELTAFQSRLTGSSVELLWTTSNEFNFSHFEVERSHDATHWIVIGKVAGTNRPGEQVEYRFQDDAPLPLNFYRLKQIDFDGNHEYSKIVSAALGQGGTVHILPNPATHELHLQGTGDLFTALIFDQNGSLKKEATTSTIVIEDLIPGVYFIKILGEGGQSLHVGRFVKQG